MIAATRRLACLSQLQDACVYPIQNNRAFVATQLTSKIATAVTASMISDLKL